MLKRSWVRARKILRWTVIVLVVSSLLYLLWLPDVRPLRTKHPDQSALMIRREEQARHAGKRVKSFFVWRDLSHISPHLVHAVLLAEDDTFYRHSGFDFQQIGIALRRDWREWRFAYGGSTLTQQLARTLYLSTHKNLLRKAKEALIAVRLERELVKPRILELYLNYAEWGRGIYGAEAAAQSYFKTSAEELTVEQAIALAAILPSPRRWNPLSEREFMIRRRTQIYERMQREGYVPATPVEPLPELVPELL